MQEEWEATAAHARPEDKYHYFNAFFYKKLSQRDAQPGEGDTRTPEERAHDRVRKWTKDVDLFAKDFMYVPGASGPRWRRGPRRGREHVGVPARGGLPGR